MRSNLRRRTNRNLRIASLASLAIVAVATLGCWGSPTSLDPPDDPSGDPPIVAESYALDDVNRPLTDAERAAATEKLDADPNAFLRELADAPAVRQAELIFVLQTRPAVASQHRETLEALSRSDQGIVRRAALFALDAVATDGGSEDR